MQRKAIFLRINGNRAQAELGRGSHDPDGDLPTVGDQNTAYPLRHNDFHSRIRREFFLFIIAALTLVLERHCSRSYGCTQSRSMEARGLSRARSLLTLKKRR